MQAEWMITPRLAEGLSKLANKADLNLFAFMRSQAIDWYECAHQSDKIEFFANKNRADEREWKTQQF